MVWYKILSLNPLFKHWISGFDLNSSLCPHYLYFHNERKTCSDQYISTMDIEPSGEASTSPQALKRASSTSKKLISPLSFLVGNFCPPHPHTNADPDPNPAVKNNTDLCGSGSPTLVYYTLLWRIVFAHINIFISNMCFTIMVPVSQSICEWM